jgi:ribosomal protein L28
MVSYAVVRPGQGAHPHPDHLEEDMARSCAKCGKTSMGGFNPQSTGMNRVRARRRYGVNLQPLLVVDRGRATRTLICTRCRRTMMKAAS